MVVKCDVCGRFLSAVEAVTCSGCQHTSHRECVGMSAGVQVGESWRCPDCRGTNPVKASTPIQVGAPSMVEAMATGTLETTALDATAYIDTSRLDTSVHDMQGSVLREMRELRNEIREARQEFRELRTDVVELKALVARCDGRVGAVESRIDALEKRLNDEEAARSVQTLEATIARLKTDLADREQDALGNDVDISGVPETKGENIVHIVLGCAAKVGMRLDERELVSCQRVGAVREAGGGAVRPRPIAVRLVRRSLRDELLKAARVRRTATTDGVGVPADPTRFYVNERLTRDNRRLLFAARESARLLKWRYVWTREGRIYARKAQGEPGHRIRAEPDIFRVFGAGCVGLNDTVAKP